MKLSEKQKTIKLLDKLRLLNHKSAFIYRIAYGRENILLRKNIYSRLYDQKLEFQYDLEEMIERIKKEISPIPDPELLSFYHRKRLKVSELYLKYKMKHNFAENYKREMKSLETYLKYLSKINHGCVREVLLKHKYGIKTMLREMNNTGIMKFPTT